MIITQKSTKTICTCFIQSFVITISQSNKIQRLPIPVSILPVTSTEAGLTSLLCKLLYVTLNMSTVKPRIDGNFYLFYSNRNIFMRFVNLWCWTLNSRLVHLRIQSIWVPLDWAMKLKPNSWNFSPYYGWGTSAKANRSLNEACRLV